MKSLFSVPRCLGGSLPRFRSAGAVHIPRHLLAGAERRGKRWSASRQAHAEAIEPWRTRGRWIGKRIYAAVAGNVGLGREVHPPAGSQVGLGIQSVSPVGAFMLLARERGQGGGLEEATELLYFGFQSAQPFFQFGDARVFFFHDFI